MNIRQHTQYTNLGRTLKHLYETLLQFIITNLLREDKLVRYHYVFSENFVIYAPINILHSLKHPGMSML